MHEFGARCASRGDVVVNVGPDPAWAKVGGYTVREAVRALLQVPAGQPVRGEALGAPESACRGLGGALRRRQRARRRRLPLGVASRRGRRAELGHGPVRREGRAGPGRGASSTTSTSSTARAATRSSTWLADPPPRGLLLVVTYAPGTSPVGAAPGEAWVLEPLPVDAFADSRAVPKPPATRARCLRCTSSSSSPGRARARSPRPTAWPTSSPAAPSAWRPTPATRSTPSPSGATTRRATSLKKMLPATVDLGAALDALDRAKIVSIDERGVRIAHPLVRRVVPSTIPAGRKRELFARADELRPDAPLEVRAQPGDARRRAFEALSLLDVLANKRAAAGDTHRQRERPAPRPRHRRGASCTAASSTIRSSAMLVFSRKLAEALAASEQWNDAEGVLREALGQRAADERAPRASRRPPRARQRRQSGRIEPCSGPPATVSVDSCRKGAVSIALQQQSGATRGPLSAHW